MKKFFEQMIMDSVSAVKDELLARLKDSENNVRNQRTIAIPTTDEQKFKPKNYQAIRSQQVNNSSESIGEDFDNDEFPIVAYPDPRKKYSEEISEPMEGDTLNDENNFSDSSETYSEDINMINKNLRRIPKLQNRHFFVNHESFSDGEHRISMLNAYNKNRRLNIMILGAVFGLVFCLLMLTFYKGDLPGEVVGIISTVSGIFGSCLKDAYSFEFGSSRGSKEKDDKITSTLLKRLKV